MTIEDVTVIDEITVSPDGRTYELLMTEERRFGPGEEQYQQLAAKIDNYVTFLQQGQLQEQYPESAGAAVRVCLVCRDEPEQARLVELMNAAARLFARHGVEFYLDVIPDELLGLPPRND